ncbi:hypothetical protein GCM10009616_03820 [Microlunatus lacustris]
MTSPTIVLAGPTGDLGSRIATALLVRGADLRALLRPDAPAADRDRLTSLGATVVSADPADVDALARVLLGTDCVVSALNGLGEVILDRQSVLLDAAVRAGVPRFISSDYSADFTKTEPGRNRNFDLRREFSGRADRASIKVTSVLNGAFMDMLGAEMPIIQPRIRRVLHWGEVDQPLDFTTKDDTAAYTAAAAMDETAPRTLRIAGDTVSAREIAQTMTEVTGQPYRTLRAGSVGGLGAMIRLTQLVAPEHGSVFPAWQGMQYMRDMFSGTAQLVPLDNDRYPDLTWTRLHEQLADGPLAGRSPHSSRRLATTRAGLAS